MFGLTAIVEMRPQQITNDVERATFRNVSHGLASIRNTAIESIDRSDEPSAPGEPPHTRDGQLPGAIQYAAEDADGVVGPVASRVGQSGAAHEFGEEFRGFDYDERPFMAPAMDASLDRFASEWAGSIG